MGTAAAALAALLLVVAAAAPGPAAAQAPVEPGRGQAIAQAFKLDPRAASLSIGITFGMSLAGHQNTVATAESRSIELGIIGDLLAAEGCDGGEPTWPEEDQPQSLRTHSNEEGSAQGKSETEYGVVAKTVRATDAPFGEALTRYNELEIPGLVTVSNTRSMATSGLVDAGREAVAVTELGSLVLAGGLVELNGLRWEARHSEAGSSGSFSIGGADIAGRVLALPAGDPSAAVEAVNTALTPLGLRLTAPEVREASGIVFVEPLVLSVVPSETRDGVINTLLGAVQDQREQLVDALLEMDCGNATYITVLDVVLGTVSGAGQLGLELGGVQASTAEIAFSNRLGGLGGGLPPVAPPPAVPVETPRPGTVAPPSVTPPPAGPPAAGGGTAVAPPPATVAGTTGARGGVLAVIGAAGLAALAAAAEADRRKMRRAQRLVPGASS